MVSIVTFDTSMSLSLANSGHCAKGDAGGRRAELLALELLGLGDAAALARHDRVRRLVVDHEYRLDRCRRMLVAILDERIDIGEGHVIAAAMRRG